MPIYNRDQVINALSVDERKQEFTVQKYSAANIASYRWQTLWTSGDMPSAGSYPTAGVGNAAACDSSTTGACPITAATGGRKLWLGSTDFAQYGFNEILIVDRLAHAQIANNQATAAFSPVIDGTARLASGEGGQIIVTSNGSISAASNGRQFTYTNQDGTAGRTAGGTTGFISIASASSTAVIYTEQIFVSLQDGDSGVRTITDTTLVSGTATGNLSIDLVKPIARILCGSTTSIGRIKQLLVDLPGQIEISSSACLAMYVFRRDTNPACLVGKFNLIEI